MYRQSRDTDTGPERGLEGVCLHSQRRYQYYSRGMQYSAGDAAVTVKRTQPVKSDEVRYDMM